MVESKGYFTPCLENALCKDTQLPLKSFALKFETELDVESGSRFTIFNVNRIFTIFNRILNIVCFDGKFKDVFCRTFCLVSIKLSRNRLFFFKL